MGLVAARACWRARMITYGRMAPAPTRSWRHRRRRRRASGRWGRRARRLRRCQTWDRANESSARRPSAGVPAAQAPAAIAKPASQVINRVLPALGQWCPSSSPSRSPTVPGATGSRGQKVTEREAVYPRPVDARAAVGGVIRCRNGFGKSQPSRSPNVLRRLVWVAFRIRPDAESSKGACRELARDERGLISSTCPR